MSRSLDHDLLEAVNANKFEAVRTILQNPKVDVNKFNCIHWAVTFEKVEMTKLLIEAGANLNQLGMAGKESPLLIAVGRQNLALTEMLLNAGADPSLGSAHGSTPIMMASKKEVAALLLKFGAQVNCSDKKGVTPLMKALTYHRMDVVQLLIAAGADVNVKDKDGYTPLIAAVEKGYEPGVKALLQGGADTNIRAESGRSVFEIAQHAGIIKLLQAYRQGSSFTKDDEKIPAAGSTIAAPPEKKAGEIAASAIVSPPAPPAISQAVTAKSSAHETVATPPAPVRSHYPSANEKEDHSIGQMAQGDDVPGAVHVRGRGLFSRLFGGHSQRAAGTSRRGSTGGVPESSPRLGGASTSTGSGGRAHEAAAQAQAQVGGRRERAVVAPASVVGNDSGAAGGGVYDGAPVAVAMAVGVEQTEAEASATMGGRALDTFVGSGEEDIIRRLAQRVAALERQVSGQDALLQQQARDIAELKAHFLK